MFKEFLRNCTLERELKKHTKNMNFLRDNSVVNRTDTINIIYIDVDFYNTDK